MRLSIRAFALRSMIMLVPLALTASASAEPVVPGTGTVITQVGDDFEDPEWEYDYNLPKSSKNLNKFEGGYGGESKNDRWYEGVKRGQPDIVKRVPTPKGGLPGSEGAMLLQSLQTGVPGRPSYQLQQDDFIANVNYNIGAISVASSPSVVTRVFLPPVDQWEDRTGPSFAFRVALETRARKTTGVGLFSRTSVQPETYWPGMFIEFQDKSDTGLDYDTAYIRIRANGYGGDYKGPAITTTGWWTLGISVTPDGMVHYYAKPGVEDLTAEDHIASEYPYGYRALSFKTFFYNVCNGDDGQTWSTPWVVDDPKVYVIE